MFGRNNIEWGVRFGTTETWYPTKAKAEAAIKRMKKNTKSGKEPKLIQRSGQKSGCSGGKCKGPYTCRKHSKSIKGSDFELYDKQGRNKNTKRWDE